MKQLTLKIYFKATVVLTLIIISGCNLTENRLTRGNSLKSSINESLKETTRFSDNDQKIFNEFVAGDQWKLMMSGSDPTIGSEEDLKQIKFSVIPVFSVDGNVDFNNSENLVLNKMYKKSTDTYVFLGRVDKKIVTRTIARTNQDGSWRFEIPALKNQMVDWGKRFDLKKSEADEGEVFYLQIYGLMYPAFYKKGELKWMMGHMNGPEKGEEELVTFTLKTKETIEKNKKYYDDLKTNKLK